MDKQLTISPAFKFITYGLIGIGIITLVLGFINNPAKTWANYLLNNYYFLSIVVGATFFGALQYITQSGWSAGFVRIHQAISNFYPVVFILMLPILFFGMHDLYHWSHAEAVAHDPIIAHKAPYLNMTFFSIRLVIYFAVWFLMTQVLKRYSLKEDQAGGLKYFKKSEFLSKVYIFSLALTFSLFTFDWIMSIDVHWFSTIFAVRNFISGFYHGVVIITLIILILNQYGYLPFLTTSHLRDLTKYIFILGILWAYTWFSQYILIWYANIPEDTIYYLPRVRGAFVSLFYLEVIINWLLPFLVLMSNKLATNKTVLFVLGIILVIGQWIDLYEQIIVGSYGKLEINYIEVGTFLGFLGLFALVVALSLEKHPLIAKNHPYLTESTEHHEH